MKLRSYRVERTPKLMIIPMIDIIFFLLVFFMMSTLNMVYQKTLPINLPLAASSQQDAETPLIITLSKTGQVHLEQEEIPLEALQEQLKKRLAAQAKRSVILRADQAAEHGKVVAIMDELKMAGVQKLAIATQGKTR